jgi:hypothetical protein
VTTSIAEYSATESALAELRGKYAAVVYDVTTTKGMTEAKAARAELRTLRVNLEAKRKEIKAPALKRCNEIDTEAKRITAELSALEDPIDDTIKAEEQRKEREKAERERLEQERITAINARFADIKALPLRAVNATVEEIDAVIAEAEAIDPTTFPDNLRSAAEFEQRIAIASLRAARDQRVAHDAEQKRIREERAELERLRAEQAAVQAERDRLAQEEQARAVAERQRLEEAARAERDAAERAAREARDAEQARIDAERAERRRAEDAEREAAAEKLRQEQAAAAAERARFEAEQVAARKAAREAEIASATLLSAASDALAFLRANGHEHETVTLKLAAAINREPQQKAA